MDGGVWMMMVGRRVREDESGVCGGWVDWKEEEGIVYGAKLRNGRIGEMGGSLHFHHYHSDLHPDSHHY